MENQLLPKIDKDSFTKVKDYFNSEKFPYHGSETYLLDAKTRPKDLEVGQIISTNFTSEQEACNIPLNDLAPNFGPLSLSRCLPQESGNHFEKWSFKDVFNKHDDALAQDQEIPLIYSAHEENSKLIKIPAVPAASIQNNEEFEEHKSSDKSSCKSYSNESICDIINFIEPARKLYTVLNTDSAEQEANSDAGAGFPWVKKESLNYLKRENHDELLAFLRPLITKELRITDHQALFTFFNSRTSLAFPIFSYNLLQYLDDNGNSLSKRTLDFFAISHKRHKIIESLSVTLWAIFEVRVSDRLKGFIFRVDTLESFPVFNHHHGVRELLNLLRCLFKDLRGVFANLVLCKDSGWIKPQSSNKFEEIDSKGGLPELAKQKLCELMQDLYVFMKENRWVYLLELSKEHLIILDTGFKEAENLVSICVREIFVMIDKNII